MSFRQQIFSGLYLPFKTVKSIGRFLGIVSPESLRVLLYHDIPPNQQEHFAVQLRWLARSWNFVSAVEFGEMMSGNRPIRGRNLLLTFDDGFASNRVVAEKILNPMRIPALFFVVSGFAELDNFNTAQHFISDNILPGTPVTELPDHLYNMNWNDLSALLEQGHTIGAHTANHKKLTQLDTDEERTGEIITSANRISTKLGVPIEHFAYTFGDINSIDKKALAVTRTRFKFVYSGIRGSNTKDISPFAIRRDAIAPQNSVSQLGSFVEGLSDPYYMADRKKIDDLVQ